MYICYCLVLKKIRNFRGYIVLKDYFQAPFTFYKKNFEKYNCNFVSILIDLCIIECYVKLYNRNTLFAYLYRNIYLYAVTTLYFRFLRLPSNNYLN